MPPAFALTARAACCLLTATLLPLAAQANAIGDFGARVGALPGYGSMVTSGGSRSREAELDRADRHGNEATARGVLRDGALHAAAVTVINDPRCRDTSPSTCKPSTATAQVELWDILTFTRDDLADPSQIRWRFDIHGFETNGPNHGGTASASFTYQVDTWDRWVERPLFSVQNGDVIRGSLAMTGETMTVRFYAGLRVSARDGGWADYGNTARFFLDLPQGVTLASSRSGVFLADRPPIPAVPEPPVWALGLAGAATLGWLRRRRPGPADAAAA